MTDGLISHNNIINLTQSELKYVQKKFLLNQMNINSINLMIKYFLTLKSLLQNDLLLILEFLYEFNIIVRHSHTEQCSSNNTSDKDKISR